jgi:hypothetical protein
LEAGRGPPAQPPDVGVRGVGPQAHKHLRSLHGMSGLELKGRLPSSPSPINVIGKSLLFLPQFSQKFVFPPSTPKLGKSPLSTFQTVHFTSLERFRRRFYYSKRWFCYSEAVLSFSFLFTLAESLKNHSKSQKNQKMKNLILLHST